MTTVFKRPEVKAFFEEAVKISTYKESRWDAKVLADLYSLSSISMESIPKPSKSSGTFKPFIDYLGDVIRKEYDEMISKGISQSSVFRQLKMNHKLVISRAFRLFKKENPGKTIYEMDTADGY